MLFGCLISEFHQDAETVAAGIQEVSGGKIRTGVYHADIGDAAKETLHKKWRKGEVKVVCATIGTDVSIVVASTDSLR